jgi:hypothetical protein
MYNDDLYNVFPSPNIIRLIKSRRIRWTGHVVRMVINAYKI